MCMSLLVEMSMSCVQYPIAACHWGRREQGRRLERQPAKPKNNPSFWLGRSHSGYTALRVYMYGPGGLSNLPIFISCALAVLAPLPTSWQSGLLRARFFLTICLPQPVVTSTCKRLL